MIPNPWISGAVQAALLLLGGGAGSYGLFKYLNERRRLKHESEHSDADTARILNSSAIGLLAPAREQVDFLRRELVTANAEIVSYRNRVVAAEAEVDKLTDHIQELTAQVRDLLAENQKLQRLIRANDKESHDG